MESWNSCFAAFNQRVWLHK